MPTGLELVRPSASDSSTLDARPAFLLLDSGRVVLETDDAAAIARELLERVFRVRADRAVDGETGEAFWRFRL